MDTQESISQLVQFRQELYQTIQTFGARADAVMDLLDALASMSNARSVVELSLSPLFRREYSSVSDAIAHFFKGSEPAKVQEERRAWEKELSGLIGRYLPRPTYRRFWLFGTDVVPIPRPFARALEDRTFVYQPNTVRGNRPVAIGHQYSELAFFPEKTHIDDPPWVVPLVMRRVSSTEKATMVGAEQVAMLMEDERQPFHDELCVHVADSTYSAANFLGRVGKYKHLVNVTRTAENRVFYRQFPPLEGKASPGHPQWYGERFSLKDDTTWWQPDVVAATTFTTKKGRTYQVRLEGWCNMLMRGKKDLPMHKYPFTLVRARVLDEQGQPVFKRTLWLVVMGERRDELSLVEAWEAYGQRYDIEHYFRFGKQRLLMAAYQTPEVEHEENWQQIVQLASVQLWLARDLAAARLRPWERYLPQANAQVASPSLVQRDFERIIRQIGTPASAPKRRGKSLGRAKGTRPARRKRHSVIKKSKKASKKVSQPVKTAC